MSADSKPTSYKAQVVLPSFIDLLNLFRFRDWFYLLGLSLFAIVDFYPNGSPGVFLSAILYCAYYLACGYVTNNYFDTEEDKIEKNAFVGWPKDHSLFLIIFVMALFFVFSLFLDLLIESICVFIVSLIYSIRPLRLKDHFLPSIFANVVFFCYLYYATVRIITPEATLGDMPFLLFVAAMFVPLQFLHIEEHRQSDDSAYFKRPLLLLTLLMLPPLATFIPGAGFSNFDVTVCFANCVFIFFIYRYFSQASVCRQTAKLGCLIAGSLLFFSRVLV